MHRMMAAALTALVLATAPARAEDLEDALGTYLDFASYTEGVIMVEQLTPEILPDVTFIDTRSAEEFATDGIEGALNVEWRETLERLDALPESGMVVLYCNTSVLSTQAMMVARLMGRSNVLVLQGGLNAWAARES